MVALVARIKGARMHEKKKVVWVRCNQKCIILKNRSTMLLQLPSQLGFKNDGGKGGGVQPITNRGVKKGCIKADVRRKNDETVKHTANASMRQNVGKLRFREKNETV